MMNILEEVHLWRAREFCLACGMSRGGDEVIGLEASLAFSTPCAQYGPTCQDQTSGSSHGTDDLIVFRT